MKKASDESAEYTRMRAYLASLPPDARGPVSDLRSIQASLPCPETAAKLAPARQGASVSAGRTTST